MTTVVDRRSGTNPGRGQLSGVLVAARRAHHAVAIRGCALCGDLAVYQGRACADSHVLNICKSCLDAAIRRLSQLRDDTKLATGTEPICNRCWRPILDPETHMDLRALWE